MWAQGIMSSDLVEDSVRPLGPAYYSLLLLLHYFVLNYSIIWRAENLTLPTIDTFGKIIICNYNQ
jgi:hypothetical protein